jgi:hypothetical protein
MEMCLPCSNLADAYRLVLCNLIIIPSIFVVRKIRSISSVIKGNISMKGGLVLLPNPFFSLIE